MKRAQAIDEILALAHTAWTVTAGQEASRWKWENVAQKAVPPSGQQPWGRIILRHTESGQTSLAGADGRRRFTRMGVLQMNIFEPVGQGMGAATDLPEIMKNAYEGITTAGGVIFSDVTIREIGENGDFYQTNVTASFEYDEVK